MVSGELSLWSFSARSFSGLAVHSGENPFHSLLAFETGTARFATLSCCSVRVLQKGADPKAVSALPPVPEPAAAHPARRRSCSPMFRSR